ncbi:nitrate/nitrite transport system ATP-binding protein [Alteromonadaceae bacterium 2753L.S.0a.02]|nr:nitrate/nitrite transport system ATP-binding protein [Alteromonadaceae bacterium 2753L.S.0a.02]
MTVKSFLKVENLAKRFPSPKGEAELTVFENVSFSIEKGEFVCIIGHSGCGKSTIINTLAGLDTPSDGIVLMDEKEVSGPSLDRGMVFQNYSLLPWLSALDNVRFGVRARWPNWSKDKLTTHSLDYLEMVGLSDVVNRKPAQLSGGMRQRVSIARAFATQPKLLLLDEPFGALDALTRGNIQDELINIWGRMQQTVFMITHDVDEAILLADKILLMSNGPNAVIAESVTVDISRPRVRADIIKDESYYHLRNYLVDFLVNRSDERPTDANQTLPKVVNPIAGIKKKPSLSAVKATKKTIEMTA